MSKCICGKEGTFKIGTVTHHPKDTEIKIHNIPHEYCNFCGAIWYDILKVKPSKYIKYAYENGLSEIDYNTNLNE